MKINWNQASTKRGAVWVVTFVIGVFMVLNGLDVSQLLLLAAGVAGGIGMVTND